MSGETRRTSPSVDARRIPEPDDLEVWQPNPASPAVAAFLERRAGVKTNAQLREEDFGDWQPLGAALARFAAAFKASSPAAAGADHHDRAADHQDRGRLPPSRTAALDRLEELRNLETPKMSEALRALVARRWR